MKLLWAVLLLIPTVSLANPRNPKPSTPDQTYQNDKDLLDLTEARTGFLTENTSGQILVGQGVGINPIWQSTASFNVGKILQISTFTTTVTTQTTSTSFVPTNSTLSVTLTRADSRVFIVSSAVLGISTNVSALAGLYRGSTALHDATNGQCQTTSAAAAATLAQCTMIAFDTPGSVGPHTYNVRFRVSSAATATYGNSLTASLAVFEIGQ